MTTPGALPPRSSVYAAPAIAPGDMTESQNKAFQVAQVAAVVSAVGVSSKSISDSATLLLVPLLRTLDPYNAAEVAAFALKAAELVEMARQEAARVSWGAINAQLTAYGRRLPADFQLVGKGRKTALEMAYRRPAADYRRRMAAGVESIRGVIAQMEEERFQALGGAEVAARRTGESNAKIEGTKRSPTAGSGSKSSSGSGGSGAKPASSGSASSTGGAGAGQSKPAPRDRAVNADPDDFDDAGERDARRAEEDAADAAYDAEQELRRQAQLSDEEKQLVLQDVAEQEMEVRAERMVNDDIAMASRQANLDAMKSARGSGITGYRRVLHPELSGGGSCGLCIAASTRVYKIGELLPIHNLCKCGVAIIIGDDDPGSQINDEDLAVLYAEAGDTTDGRALKDQRYEVFDHPELGPVLRNKKHKKATDIKFSSREQ